MCQCLILGFEDHKLCTDKLIELLKECAIGFNRDTCGMCHLHFSECEDDLQCVWKDDNSDIDMDIPPGREFACPGARARQLLKPLKIT